MKIYKFGGTSIGSIEKIKNVANLISDNTPKVVMLSATSETVNSLETISTYLFNHEIEKAHDAITRLEFKFIDLFNNLLNNDEIKKKAVSYVLDRFRIIWNFTKDAIISLGEKTVLIQGEMLSTALVSFYLEEQGIRNTLLYSSDFIKIGDNMQLDMDYLKTSIKNTLITHEKTSIFVAQGNICINSHDKIDLLKQKESDSNILSIGKAIKVDEIQIWKDVDNSCNSYYPKK